ncbi:MAG: hypothetical protein J6Y33_03525 [Prevotella sp.]|nr:hypothetical protein [Prevotella sp.]
MPNLDMNDLMAIRGIDRDDDRRYGWGGYGGYGHGGMTPYEQMKVSHMEAKRPSGVAIAGLTVGSVAVVAGIGAWVFGGMQASAKAKEAAQIGIAAKEQAALLHNASTKLLETVQGDTQRTIDRILRNVADERRERISDGVRITQSVADTISGQQSTSQSQSTVAENSAYATAMNQIVSDRLTGRSSLDAQPVCLYSSPKPCDCPGCGCNG